MPGTWTPAMLNGLMPNNPLTKKLIRFSGQLDKLVTSGVLDRAVGPKKDIIDLISVLNDQQTTKEAVDLP